MNDLERAIVDHPDDTELRLVFADSLEEHGDLDRAEFIREARAREAVVRIHRHP